jgi:hypothetical protein
MGLTTTRQPSAAVTGAATGTVTAGAGAVAVTTGDSNGAAGEWLAWGDVEAESSNTSTLTSYVLPSRVILNIFIVMIPF